MPKYKPLYSLYKGLRESKYDVPDSYASFQKTLTQAGNAGAKSRRGLYQSLKDSNYDVPDTYEDFYKNLFVPVNSTTSRALKIGENPNTPTVNRYRQKMFDSVDPNKNGLNNLSNRAVGQAVRATNNVRKPVIAKVVNQKGKPTGKEFAITPAKTAEDLDREYAQETTKNWENELHDQIADADKDAAKISDMFKSFIGSTDEVGSVWGNMTRGGGIAGTPHSVTTNNGILENTEARQILAAGDYNRKRRELLQLEQDSRNGAIFDNHSFFRGMYDAAKDTGFLTGGASDLINAGSLLATKQDLDNGVHTEAGDMLMQQAVKNSDAQSQYGDNQGWMYTGGVITTNMAPFMVQIGSAGFSKGMSNAIGKVVQGAASKVALGTMEKATGIAGAHIANYIGKVTGLTTKAFGKAIQYGIVGAAQANTVGLGNVANDVINRYTGQVYQDEQGNYKFGTFDSDGKLVHEGGEDFLTALVKGEAAQTIEFATELAGGGIDAAGTALKNFVTKGGKKIINKYNMENVSKVIDFLLNNKVSKNARYLKAGADRTLGKVEVNSIVGESLEEELGIIANTVFTGDNKISDLWDEKQQSQIWGGMLLSIGLMKGAVAPFHAYNAKQYYSYKHKLDKADVNLSQLLGKEKWEELRNQIDATTNDDIPEMINKINRDVALGKNRQPVREYIQNLLIMRGYDIGNMLAAKKAVEDKGEGVSVKNMEKNQAYQQGRDAYGYDTHEIQLDQEDKQKSLAQLIGISEQQLASMSDEELEALSGRDDNIDRAIYDYQLSTARYEGVIDNARDQIDLEVQRAAQAVDMYTDKSRNTIRNATIKATGGLEDYGVYIINGNIATHEDGSIDISNSDDMILYYDPTTNTVEHADATMFAELGSEENADEVRSQAMADAKEKAIKETTGIIDGVVEVGTQFKTVGADGTEHTYEVLADNGDGTAMITIDGNVPTELVNGESVNIPVSFEELQKMKDEYDQQRLQAAKAEREQMEKERAVQQTQETEQTQPSFDFNQILNDNGNVVLVDVLDKDGNTKYPDSKLFLIRDTGAKAKVVELKSDGTIVPHAVNKEDVATISSMSLDEYKQAMPESSMIEDNSGEESDEDSQLENLGLPKGSEIWMSGDGFGRPKENTLSKVVGIDEQGSIILEDKDGKKWSASFDYINNHRELPPLDENTNIVNEENNQSESNAEENTPAPEQTPAMTLEDGTIVPMLEDGNPDFSKLTAAQTAELYDTQFGEDADSIVSGYVSDAKKALDKASNMTVKGKTFVEQKAAKDAKEKAIADAQAAYDSAIAIRDAYNERQLAKVEDTAEGRKELIEKARRKFARLKSAVKDDAEAVSQLYRETIGSLLHRLYDSTGIDVTDTTPLTAEEYVASNLGAHSLNYEGTETSKGVKQETGLSREDFAKTQLLAADGKGITIDALVHSLWENRPSNLESLDTQDIRNALIGVLNSGFKASEARNFVENIRIAQAENILEEQKRAQEDAAYSEQHKAEPEAELKAKSDEKAELKAKLDNESDNKSNDLSNESDNENINDNINDNINTPEVPEDATDENPLGLQLSEDKVPFEIEGGKSGETYDINDNEDRQRLINDNKVDDKDILDIDMPKHVHKAIKELCKKMGLKVQFLYMGARSNGWIENGTMYLALDTEKATQFVFGHEMTHAIKQKNPEAYKELVKVAMAVTTKKKFEEDLAKVYQNYHGISGYNNVDDYVEEVVADNLGKFINDFDLAQKFSLRLNHPVLGTILHAIQKIKSLLYGDFYKSVDALERIVEKAYVDTAKGEVTNSETGEDVSYSLRQKPEPKKKGIGYKVFVLKDEKTLVGVHNISEEKLLKAIKQGGLANPSVAVIDSSRQDHKAYGGISLILPSDKIAKRTGKNAGTWQGDAYTPTYPEVEKQMSNKGAEKSSSDVLSVPKEMQHEVRNGIDRWLNGGDANSGLKYLFLHEKGVAPEPKMIQPKFSDEAYNELKFITAGDFNIYGIGKADAQKVLDMYIEAKFDGDKDLYEEKTKAWLERNKSIVDAGAKGGMRYAIAKENVELYDEYGFNYKGVQTFVRDVEYDHRKSGVDTNAALNDVEDYIKTNNLTDEFNTWLEGKEKEYGIKEVIFDGFTPSGNRRYVPNTLENVSKIMKKQGRNGATGAAVSFQNFAARLMPSYGTLKDIRSKKGLLTSDREKFDKFREKWSNVFFELGMKCQPDATGTFDDYGLARLSEAAMTSDPQAYLKKEYNVDFSDEDTKRLKEMVKAIKEEHPAMYFETKFERPVRFDEFSAAAVPTTTKKEVKEALKNAGVSIFEYDEKSDSDRKRAFNEAINSSDNIRFSLAGERGAADMAEDLKSLNTPDEVDDAIKTAIDDMPSGWKMANKKMIHIAQALGENRKAEIAGEEPKFSLKDGTLIKAGTYFSGGGLVEEGLKGIIDPVVAVEYDEKISGVYRNNFGQHIVTADVRDVDPKELVKQIDGEVEYFHASPVCKNYSQAKSNHAEVELDKETAASTAEFINSVKPKVVTIENVKGYKDSEAMKIITDALDANGYTWDADVYNAADYGGYTNRERLIVRAVRDGKLPEKPKKMAHKSGWYEAVADIIPTLTEKKNGVAPWMDIRLKADGIDWRNIDKPLYVMGSAYADGKVPHAFADELLPTLRTKSGDVIVMPDGKVYRAMGRVLARVSGVSDDYKMPFSESLSHTIIGNGIPTQLTEHVIAPLLTGSDPKFSIRTYHGTGASFDKFDLSHALEGEGSESFGHGVYVTNSSKIGREYAQRAKNRKMEDLYKNMRYPDGVKGDIFKRRVFGEMVNDVATGGSVASAKEFAKKRVGADANDIQRTLENLKDREKGTEYEQNLKDRLAEYKEGLNWIDSLDEDYLTQGNVNRYDVDIPDDNGSNYLDWEGTIPDSLDKQKVAEDAYKVVSDNQGFNDFKATPLNDFIAHTLKTYVNTTDVAGRVEKLKSDIKDVIENYVADDDVLALNEYLKDATPDDVLATIWYNDLVRDIKDADLGEELYRKLSTYVGDNAASQILSDNGLVGIKYPAGLIHGGAEEGDYNYVIFDENNANIVGNTRFSLRYDQFEHDLNQWKKDNNLPKDAQRPTIPQRNAGESAVDFLRRVDEYRKQMALWKTAPTYEQHLLSNDTALGEFNRELQRGSVLKRIAFQDSMLAIRKAQEAIMKEVGVDRLNMAEDAYTAENRSHGKGKNEFEEYNNEFLQPLRKAYHQMKKVLGDSYDNVRIYMMAKHGLERDAQMAFKKSLEADYEDVAQRSAAYKAYKGDMNRIINDSDLEFGRVDFTTWRQRDNALRVKYSPSYMDYRYDKNGIAYDYSGLSALFEVSDFEEAAHKLVKDIESKYVAETHDLWDATNAATKKILRDGYKAGMMSKDTYQYVRDMYSHYIPLRGWDGTTADQVWDYIGGGKGAFNQTLKKAHGRTSIADDPIAYIENMAESGILLNNKNWVKQHLMLLAQNHPTSLLTLSKAWYVKSTDANGNEEWIPATPQITSQMNSNQVKAAIDAFEKKMEQMAQTGDATQQREGLNIAYPQTHSEEREHEVRVMKDGEEYVIYVNGDPQLAQAMNNTRAHRVSEGIKNSISKRVIAVVGRKMAAAYTSLSPLFIPSNYFRDLTMTLASTAIREDAKYNYLLGKNLTTSWNLGFMLKDYQNGKLREKVSNGNATPKEQMFYDFMMNGGETGFVSSLDVEDLKKKFKNDLKDLDRWKVNPVKVGHTIMDCIEFLNRMIEDSNRFAIYMTSIQYGRSIDEAVNDAKDVTLNFNRKGTGEHSWQTIRNLYLFINPAVQSLQTLGALAKHHPFKFTAVTASWLASGVLVPIVNVALMQLGAAFLGGDGDDDKDWYKDISKKYWQFTKWDRRNNFIMWVPTTHEFVKIPLAQEFRAFYGLGDMIASKMMGGELAEESWEDYGWDLVGQVVDMLPLDPTGYDGELGVSLMPNPIRPVFELAFNVDFTGKPLFKDTEYNKYDPNFTKAYVGTPDWLVRASRMMNSIGNDYPNVQQNKWDALGNPRYNLNNPAVVDHVLSSYLGGAYTMGSQVLGLLTKSLNDRKEIKVADIPLFSKFVSNPDDRPVSKKQGDEFWDKKEYYDRASNTISKLKKQAKIDGDYSLLERFYGSEEYKTYKLYEKDVKDYKEARKKERAEESGDEYRPHQLNAEDIYNNHATPMDEFEDMKLKQLFEKLNSFKTRYDAIVDNAPNESDGYYNTNKAAIDAIDEISLDKQEVSELKKGFLDDGKDAYNAEDMKQIRDLRKKILAVLEKANKVIVVNQKAKAEK